MAAKEMYDYLSDKTADYTDTELDISPHDVMEEMGAKEQVEHKFDDGQVSIVTLSSDTYFFVNLVWNHLTDADSGTIFDFWNDENKANGRARSFYWSHPRDGHTYTVKFATDLGRSYNAVIGSRSSISGMRLRVLGNKPSS